MPGYKNIIVGTDFSEGAARAVEEAAYVAKLAGGALHIVHVVPGSTAQVGEVATAGSGRLAEKYPIEGATYAVLHGHEASKIMEYAEAQGDPLIVVGSRGVGLITGLFGGGSICDKVVGNAKCPVLVVPQS